MKETYLISGASSSLAEKFIMDYKNKNVNLILLFRTINSSTKKKFDYSNFKLFKFNFDNDLYFKKLENFILSKNFNITTVLHFNGIHNFSPIKLIDEEAFYEVYKVNVLSFIKIVKFSTKPNISKNLKSILGISSSVSSFAECSK